jgi:hypothetical protein
VQVLDAPGRVVDLRNRRAGRSVEVAVGSVVEQEWQAAGGFPEEVSCGGGAGGAGLPESVTITGATDCAR